MHSHSSLVTRHFLLPTSYLRGSATRWLTYVAAKYCGDTTEDSDKVLYNEGDVYPCLHEEREELEGGLVVYFVEVFNEYIASFGCERMRRYGIQSRHDGARQGVRGEHVEELDLFAEFVNIV